LSERLFLLAPGAGLFPPTKEKSRGRSLGDKYPKHREKKMNTRAVVILVGLAISIALPIFAQEKEDVKPFPFTPIPAGPQLVQQIETINQKFDEAFNKHDVVAVGELYTLNAVQITPGISSSGREAIEGYITDLFQRHDPTDRVTKMSYVYAFGSDLCALGGWTVTIDGSRKFGGYLLIVYTFVGGTWKIRSSVFKYPTS
jgi:ketosteroid isomerase-like protein